MWGSCGPFQLQRVLWSKWGRASSGLSLWSPWETQGHGCHSFAWWGRMWLNNKLLDGVFMGWLAAPLCLRRRRLWPHISTHQFGGRTLCWSQAVTRSVCWPFCLRVLQRLVAGGLPNARAWLVWWDLREGMPPLSSLWWSVGSSLWTLGTFRLLAHYRVASRFLPCQPWPIPFLPCLWLPRCPEVEVVLLEGAHFWVEVEVVFAEPIKDLLD